jgi:hypothetical protein
VGQQEGSIVIGELWVSYDVVLSRPTMLTTFNDTRTIQETWFNTHTNWSLDQYGGLMAPANAQYGPNVRTLLGIYPLINGSFETTPNIIGPGRYETEENWAGFMSLGLLPLDRLPPAYPAGIYICTFSQKIIGSAPGNFTISGQTSPTIRYTDIAGTAIPMNVDDGTYFASRQCAYAGEAGNDPPTTTTYTFNGHLEFSYRPGPSNQYSGFILSPPVTLFNLITGTATSEYDLRLIYLGPFNSADRFYHEMSTAKAYDKSCSSVVTCGKDEVEDKQSPPPLAVSERDDDDTDFPPKPVLVRTKRLENYCSSSSSPAFPAKLPLARQSSARDVK